MKGKRRHGVAFQVKDTNGVVVGVGDEQFAVSVTKPAGFVKLGLQKRTIFVTGLPCARKGLACPRLRKQAFDFVVVSVGDIDDAIVVANRQWVL